MRKLRERNVNIVAVENCQVEQLSTVKDRDTNILALVQEFLAVVYAAWAGCGRAASVATDVDIVAVESGNVEELSAVGDGDA